MNRPRRFNAEQVDEIRRMYRDTDMNIAQIARLMKCSSTLIAQIIDGKYKPLKPLTNDPPTPAADLRAALNQHAPFHLDRQTNSAEHRFIIRDKANREICAINPHLHDREGYADAIVSLLNGVPPPP